MRLFWIVLFSLLASLANTEERVLQFPPPNLPVLVKTSFYLVNLISVDEKNETFFADVYFTFRWIDPRLSFSGDKPQIFLEESALEKLTQIWWPQIEFLSAGLPTWNNRSLFIFPDGSVEYFIGLSANFRSRFDFTDFPFDKQVLKIEIDSFLWNKNILLFVSDNKVKFHRLEEGYHKEETILDIRDAVGETPGLVLESFGNNENYSLYTVSIFIKRRVGFFLYQVFVPLILIFGIASAVLFGFKDSFLDRIQISLTAFLVFVAAKFAINQDLPQIGYMTIIDKAFVVAYVCIALTVVVSIIQRIYVSRYEERVKKLDKYARWIIPLLFIGSIAWMFLIS
jgi:hypothetical protein